MGIGPEQYLAHSANAVGREESVLEHLTFVAQTASTFAAEFGAEAEARAAGLLHDLGKFTARFQERLSDPGHVKGVDHWSFGAEAAWVQYGASRANLAVALESVIRGHHVGLAQAICPVDDVARHERRIDSSRKLREWAVQLGEAGPSPEKHVFDRFVATKLVLPQLAKSIYRPADPAAVAGMLDVRMLFSTLVDADYLETEAHFNGTSEVPRVYREPSPLLDPDQALSALLRELEMVHRESDAAPEVSRMRQKLLEDCLAAGAGGRGVYTLTAPTGAGKTLAMLAFAMEHGRQHRMRRVIVTIPFLTIIEQTAAIYRRILRPIFGDEYIIEDHSQAGSEARGIKQHGGLIIANRLTPDNDGSRACDRRRLLAENWDAGIVLSTNVQTLESLFANRPRPCRKLHRLANSILLFDEVQTLPPHLAVATLAAVSRLVERYGCTAVFATATQPAFDHLHTEVKKHCHHGWKPTEIVQDVPRMFAVAAKRTCVEWRLEQTTSWDVLADELAAQEQVLCIVNLKRHAVGLVERLEQRSGMDGLLHLSTNLCPAHREIVLDEVRQRLKEGRPCRLISTQCIEAGVDIDMPTVYRALGPLEAIAQAAGRCNRGGRRASGRVVVFIPQRQEGEKALYPPGYGEAAEHARTFVRNWRREHGEDAAATLIHNPDAISHCFREFYNLAGNTFLPDELREAIESRDFERVAATYRLIDGNTIRILVPYDLPSYRNLRKQADPALPFDLARRWFAQAAPFAVNIFRPGRDADISALIAVHVGSPEGADDEAEWFVLADENLYDRKRLGLKGIGGAWIM